MYKWRVSDGLFLVTIIISLTFVTQSKYSTEVKLCSVLIKGTKTIYFFVFL